MMNFANAFEAYILNQRVVEWGFQHMKRVKQANGYYREYGGYFCRYENGYATIFNGESLGQTPIQEAIILDPAGIPIARDTEDLKSEIDYNS